MLRVTSNRTATDVTKLTIMRKNEKHKKFFKYATWRFYNEGNS